MMPVIIDTTPNMNYIASIKLNFFALGTPFALELPAF